MHKVKKQGGFTLIELMVGMLIISIITVGIVGVLQTTVRSWQYNQGKTNATTQGRTAMIVIGDMLNRAQAGTIYQTGQIADLYDNVTSISFTGADPSDPTNLAKSTPCKIEYIPKTTTTKSKIYISYTAFPSYNKDLAVGLVTDMKISSIGNIVGKQRQITVEIELLDPRVSTTYGNGTVNLRSDILVTVRNATI